MTKRGAHEKPTRANWLRRGAIALVLILAASGIVLLLSPLFDRSASPVADSSSRPPTAPAPSQSSSPSPSASPVTTTRSMSPDEVRAAFISLAAQDRGYDRLLSGVDLPSLAQQICGIVASGGNADAVWAAAGILEQQNGLPTAAAWDFIDVSANTYCPQWHMLVLTTSAKMGD